MRTFKIQNWQGLPVIPNTRKNGQRKTKTPNPQIQKPSEEGKEEVARKKETRSEASEEHH